MAVRIFRIKILVDRVEIDLINHRFWTTISRCRCIELRRRSSEATSLQLFVHLRHVVQVGGLCWNLSLHQELLELNVGLIHEAGGRHRNSHWCALSVISAANIFSDGASDQCGCGDQGGGGCGDQGGAREI